MAQVERSATWNPSLLQLKFINSITTLRIYCDKKKESLTAAALVLQITTIYKDIMYSSLHCSSMNMVVEALPQVVFATHPYSVWYLVMLVMVNTFPDSTNLSVFTFCQNWFRGGVPADKLHSPVTFLPSMTVTFGVRFTAGGSGGNK